MPGLAQHGNNTDFTEGYEVLVGMDSTVRSGGDAKLPLGVGRYFLSESKSCHPKCSSLSLKSVVWVSGGIAP